MVRLWGDLDALEREQPAATSSGSRTWGSPGRLILWASGAELEEVLSETDLAAGDFVRWVKQLLDLADQVADAAGDTDLRRTARETAGALRRGVVAYSSVSD